MSEVPAATAPPTRLGPGRLVLVVGPSGAGKDTLINLARSACAGDSNVVFPRRVVTRRASAFEDNEEMDVLAFRQALAKGQFALHWEAHGHFYGLPLSINDDVRAGRTVVVNVSRGVISLLQRLYEHVVLVAITAPADVLAARLASRGRSSDADLGERLHRVVDEDLVSPDMTIVNVGDAGAHAKLLTQIIRGESVARHGATANRGGNADVYRHDD
jgi:ribose 1,5-bisphosphokinase